MRKHAFCALWLFTVLSSPAQTAAPAPMPQRPIPAVEHVVIIIVDGLRPDVALLADTPTIRSMMKDGAYTLWARTTSLAVTLPSCTSMLTGVTPAKHGVIWNGDWTVGRPAYPAVPTVMEMATRAGYVTALIAGKSKFSVFNKPGAITHLFLPHAPSCSDEQVTVEAGKIIEAARPALMCVHFPGVDAAGHAKGWGSPAQLAQVGKTDAQIAQVFAALDRAGIRNSTVVLLSADHGGAGLTHGGEDARSKHIPWVVTGAGVRKAYDLTQVKDLQVNTEDTCATVCWLLGLPQQPYFDGKPVMAAFETVK